MQVQERLTSEIANGDGGRIFHVCDCCGKPAIYTLTGSNIFLNSYCPGGERSLDICKICYDASETKRSFSRPALSQPPVKQRKKKK